MHDWSHLEKAWYKNPPAFKSRKQEEEYCQKMLSDYNVPDDVQIGTTGRRVSDRLAWLMRRFHTSQFLKSREDS